ncbi:hypothetical protein [Alicyclobacillus sp. SO9]|uniref:hypothetical protein n=1 Tax=Alicyclobacillus sp. SO9 TaxID=2665646 RepID=UPI0018E79C97|nr:hypothetical protein [Alicyclobacillus sp. SO9]QQE78454.1 hypothetical protein GI364_21695 [Alicyclobacillus sp. SO9]
MLTSLFYRIPSDWIGLAVSGFVLWGYLKWFDKSQVGALFREQLPGILLVFIIFSRFLAGLMLHPTVNLKEDLLAVLSGAPVYGWIIGVAAMILYSLWGLYKRKLFTQEAFAHGAMIFYLGSATFFLYLSIVNLMPFRLEDVIRSTIFLFLFTLLQMKRTKRWISAPLRWGITGAVLFATTLFVPQVTHLFIFSAAQWLYLLVIVIGLGGEALRDVRSSGLHETAGCEEEHE